jgi:hypothetical protein
VTRTVDRTITKTETETQTRTTTRTVTKTVTAPNPKTEPTPRASVDDTDGDGCSDSYDASACVTPYEGVDDVNCPDVGTTDFEVTGSPFDDPYGLDGYDEDGVACES